MKSLSLTRPVVILMVGVPGSGKSFFARQFSEMFTSPVVSADAIRTELFQDSQYTSDEDRIVSRVANMMHEQLFKTGRSFIIDGGVNTRVSRFETTKLAKKHGYDTLIVWVQIDERSSQARSVKRVSSREYDEYNQPLTVEQYQQLAKQFVSPHSRDNVLVISGKHTFATQARMLLKRLAPARDTAKSAEAARPVRPISPQSPASTTRRLTIQ